LFLQPKPFPLLWWITAAYSARLAGGHLAIALPFGILSELLCLKIQQDLTFSSQNSLKSVILEIQRAMSTMDSIAGQGQRNRLQRG